MTPPVRHMVVRWMAWTALARVGEDGLHAIGRLILARLLWPEAFGTFTLAIAVLAGFQLACTLQLGASLVQRPVVNSEVLSTAFWSLAVLGMVGAGVLLVLARPIGAAVGHPGIVPVLQVMSALLPLGGCSAVPRALIWREFGFRQLAGLGVLGEALGTAAAVVAAVFGAGVYAFAVQALVVGVFELVVLWALVPWRPRPHWRYREFIELFRFGSPLAGRRVVDYLVSYGDRFLVGYAFGPAVLGLYALALRIVKGIAQGISSIFERVGFPVFARAQGDLERSRRGFLDALRIQAALTFPAVIGAALVAPELVPLLLGAAWAGAVPLAQILAARAAAAALQALPRAALTGRGRQWLVFSLSLGAALTMIAGWLAGVPWGAAGVAAGGSAAGLAMVPLSLWIVRREVPVAAGDCVRALMPGLAGTAAMAIGIGVAAWLMAGGAPESAVLRAAVLVLAGALCYVVPLSPWLARERRRYLARFREPPMRVQDSSL